MIDITMYSNWLFLFSIAIPFVKAEGYLCPYTDLGWLEDEATVIFDKYAVNDDESVWIRLGEVGRISHETFCVEKTEEKCNDSVGMCFWDGEDCQVNSFRQPDCFELCETVLNRGGLPCLGATCGSRETLYSICDESIENPQISDNPLPTPGRVCRRKVY